MASKILVGARVICYINGQPFGKVTSFRWSAPTPKTPIQAVDSVLPYELVPTTARCLGSIGLFRLIGDGGLEGAGIVAQAQNLPREKYFSLMLVERFTDTTVFSADNCSVTNQQWSVVAKGRFEGSFDFEALSWSNELTPLS